MSTGDYVTIAMVTIALTAVSVIRIKAETVHDNHCEKNVENYGLQMVRGEVER